MAKTYMKLDGNLVPISLDTTISKEEQTKTVTDPNFSSGNIVVTPDTGKVLSQVTVNKDTNLTTENIKDGITLYGIQGSLLPAKEEETKTISNADFSSGNLVINPTGNKVMTKVTVNKDTTNHIGENIKDGITLYGVTGTLESGGGLTENEIVEFTNESIVPITIAVYGDGPGGLGHLKIQGSMSSNGENPTTLGLIPHWEDEGWKYFYIFVNKSQHRYIKIVAPTDTRQYIKLNSNNLGIKETYPLNTWIDLNDVKGMLCEFRAKD